MHAIQLKTRQLQHPHIGQGVGIQVFCQCVEQRRADVARHGHGLARAFHQLTGERGDGGLAVGASDGQHGRGIGMRCTQRGQGHGIQAQLTASADVVCTSRFQNRSNRLGAQPWRTIDRMQVLPLHQAGIECARHKTHLGQLLLQRGQLWRGSACVGHGDLCTTTHTPACHRHARGAQAEDQDVLVLQQVRNALARRACRHIRRGGLVGLSGLGNVRAVRSARLGGGHLGKDLRHKIRCGLRGGDGGHGLGVPGGAGAFGCGRSVCGLAACRGNILLRIRLRHCGLCGRYVQRGLHARIAFGSAVRTHPGPCQRWHGLGCTERVRDKRIVRVHRSFSVDSPIRHSSMVMIQKRTTTCVSFQPLFSKWWCSGAILSRRRPSP